MALRSVLLISVALVALVALPINAASKRSHHADTTITHKVFFDIEIDGHKAGWSLAMPGERDRPRIPHDLWTQGAL